MYPASIAIMGPKKMEIISSPNETHPLVPIEIFNAARRIIENKEGCELVKTQGCMYVIKYSESGPFKEKISDEWLPVYVARIEQWSSGGIKKDEMPL